MTNPRCAIGRGPCDRRGSRGPTARSGSKTAIVDDHGPGGPPKAEDPWKRLPERHGALEIERGEVRFSEQMSGLYRAPGKEGVSDGRY